MAIQHTYAKSHNVGGPGPFTKVAITFIQGGNATPNLIAPIAGPLAINTATTQQLVTQARFDALCMIMSRYGRPVAITLTPDASNNVNNVVIFTYEGTQEGIFGASVNLAPDSMSIPAPAQVIAGTNLLPPATITDGTPVAFVSAYEGVSPTGLATNASSTPAATPPTLGTPPFYYVTKTLKGIGTNAAAAGSLLAEMFAINYDPTNTAASALFTGATPFLTNADTVGTSGGIVFTNVQITAAFIN